MSLQADMGLPGQSVLRTGSVPALSLRIAPGGADVEPDDMWCRENITRLFDYLQWLMDVVVGNPDGFNDYVAHHLPYQQRSGRIAQKELNRI